ncbi:hypothetical protein QAD02_018166 [Eretmocerus hayati]|uniref:Uncharacterized protein n=1 Tax=Eretmocerus hayati TaxID=131215 RepID=A0ACC2PFK9_9HYME|nr:hypothetical protein QAD02_018166 [Eretmocerus hayati]
MKNIAKTVNNTPKEVKAELGDFTLSVAGGIGLTFLGTVAAPVGAPNSQYISSGSNKRKRSAPPSETMSRRGERTGTISRKISVSGDVAIYSGKDWETPRKYVRPKTERKLKREADHIRIRPDAIVVNQKAGNATHAGDRS